MTEEQGFLRDFSRGALVVLLVKCIVWSAVNIGLIRLIYYLDHSFTLGETALGFLLVPVGLINAAILVDAIYKLVRKPDWRILIAGLVKIANSIYFFVILNELYSQAGPL